MPMLFVALMFALQGVPIQASQGGTIAGTLRDSAGNALAGVRIAAVAAVQSQADLADGSVMAAIAETDAEGHYRLENVPPGRYYIAAGRVDLPTYYPGTQEVTTGTILAVAAGSASEGIDFRLKDSSAGRSPTGMRPFFTMLFQVQVVTIPIDVRIEGENRIPIFGSNGLIRIRFELVNGGTVTAVPLNAAGISERSSGPVDYRVTIENLPPEFILKSMTYGPADLLTGPLQLVPSNVTGSVRTIFGLAPAQPAAPLGPSLSVVQPPPAGSVSGTPLVITLMRVPPTASTGVRVTGHAGTRARSIFLPGVPGILFSDGSFEFSGVPAGRHAIAVLDGGPMAASVIVGNADLDVGRLEATPALPVDILTLTPALPGLLGTHATGIVPLGSIRGRVVDRDTQQPLTNGIAYITGGAYGSSSSIGADGTFEFSRLLPGSYNIEVQVFGHEPVRRSTRVGDEGVDVQIEAAPVPQR